MLALATLENWYITGLNIRSAYLYGKLHEEIYMEQPKGFAVPGQECKVLHLWHALYGLKQASLAWWRTLNESLKELRFECLKSEAGIFFYKKKGTNIVIGIIYVDDALFISKTALLGYRHYRPHDLCTGLYSLYRPINSVQLCKFLTTDTIATPLLHF